MKANKKKIIVLVSMVVLLVATGCANYFLNVKGTNQPSDPNPVATPTFFEATRTDRLATKNQAKLDLDEIIASPTSSAEMVAKAEAEKLALTTNMQMAADLETLIKAQKFEDVIVTISTANVNVVVKDADLTLEDAAKIFNIVAKETKCDLGNIVIVPYV